MLMSVLSVVPSTPLILLAVGLTENVTELAVAASVISVPLLVNRPDFIGGLFT